MDILIYVGIFLGLVVFFAYQSYLSKKRLKEELQNKLNKDWGAMPDRSYKAGEFDKIKKYFNLKAMKSYIDDITWNDMGMDEVFKTVNHTWSSVGEDCLYARMRNMEYSVEELLCFDEIVDKLEKAPEIAKKMQESFIELGKTKSVCIFEFISQLASLPGKKNTEHIVRCLLLLVSLGLLFIQPIIGIVALVIMVSTNVIRYYRVKKDIDDYFTCFSYLIHMIISSKNIIKNASDISPEIADELNEIYSDVASMTKGVFLIAGNNMSGSIADSLMEYLRMLCHVDIMKFNSMLKAIHNHKDKLERMYELIGMLESACAVASYRTYLKNVYGTYCKPQFGNTKTNELVCHEKTTSYIKGEELYHPLIKDPVRNTIVENKSVLLTGSNASGKSTFLKTVGINAILAQTIYTCSGYAFSVDRCKVYSSMSLKDDLLKGESYYMVEIKALKRIIDAANRGEKIICFVDEVLRGTNTVERVSASTEILNHFATMYNGNVLCFAATHDIELTHLLENEYSNYHFEEEVVNEDVIFNYQLNKGRATSRNAIQLLKVMGYDDRIIEKARARADKLLNY